MDSSSTQFYLNGNKIAYDLTGKKVTPKVLNNETRDISISDMHAPSSEGISRLYESKNGGYQQLQLNYFGKTAHPDYDSVEFLFKRGESEPIIEIEQGKLYKDGTFTVGNTVKVGEKINHKGKTEPITRKMTTDEANVLINNLRKYIDEITPRMRRIINKIRTVKVV